jgi:hypothetical protein
MKVLRDVRKPADYVLDGTYSCESAARHVDMAAEALNSIDELSEGELHDIAIAMSSALESLRQRRRR